MRISGLECVSNLLNYFGPKYMREYEATLIGLLLMGLNDESEEVIKRTMELLERCGGKLKAE